MFGFVTANFDELTKPQRDRYSAVYCGICRRIHIQASNVSRLALSYDMAFLALLLMSLYEPEEQSGENRCMLHCVRRRPWLDSPYIRYAADMNVALAYYNSLDDWNDDGKISARILAESFGKHYPEIRARYPRQCSAIEACLTRLNALEKEKCPNPDETAGAFGSLMAELLVCEEDMWASQLRQMGFALGRFIYLMDAVVDYDSDMRKGKYNPLYAMEAEREKWEEYLLLAMGRCTQSYEKLPLVQDKALLDNILYSGVWVRARGRKEVRL